MGEYVFTNQTAFSHGLFDVDLAQSFATNTKLSLHYNYDPRSMLKIIMSGLVLNISFNL
jgi:hypothetical protein